MTEREHIVNKAKLADVILNNKESIKIGEKVYSIGALTYYTKWKISDLITKMELADDQIVTLVQAMAKNVPLMAEILALAVLNNRKNIESDKLDELKFNILDSADGMEWASALEIIFSKLDTGFFWSYGDGKGLKFDEQQGWIPEEPDEDDDSGSRWIPANTEFGEIVGLVSDLQGAFTFTQLTEEFTIPQVQIMLKDRPHMKYNSESKDNKKIDSAMGLLGSMTRQNR